jgi:hypothetical protein
VDIRNKNNGINKNDIHRDVIGEKPAGCSGWAVTAYIKWEKNVRRTP